MILHKAHILTCERNTNQALTHSLCTLIKSTCTHACAYNMLHTSYYHTQSNCMHMNHPVRLRRCTAFAFAVRLPLWSLGGHFHHHLWRVACKPWLHEADEFDASASKHHPPCQWLHQQRPIWCCIEQFWDGRPCCTDPAGAHRHHHHQPAAWSQAHQHLGQQGQQPAMHASSSNQG